MWKNETLYTLLVGTRMATALCQKASRQMVENAAHGCLGSKRQEKGDVFSLEVRSACGAAARERDGPHTDIVYLCP